jgi:hypothetical protein
MCPAAGNMLLANHDDTLCTLRRMQVAPSAYSFCLLTHTRRRHVLPLQCFFAATGVSDGDLVHGVRFFSGGASTNSVVMRGKSQTGRPRRAVHCREQ